MFYRTDLLYAIAIIYLFLLIQSSNIFYHNCLVHVSLLSCEITLQHYVVLL